MPRLDGGRFGVSSTITKINEIYMHHKEWTEIVWEMYQQVTNYFFGKEELSFGTMLSMEKLYTMLREPKKSIFKEGLNKVYTIIKTTNRNPKDLSFDLRTMRLKRKELFLVEMEMNQHYRKNLLSSTVIY